MSSSAAISLCYLRVVSILYILKISTDMHWFYNAGGRWLFVSWILLRLWFFLLSFLTENIQKTYYEKMYFLSCLLFSVASGLLPWKCWSLRVTAHWLACINFFPLILSILLKQSWYFITATQWRKLFDKNSFHFFLDTPHDEGYFKIGD